MASKILQLLESFRAIERQLALILVDSGLTVSQFRLLHVLADESPVTPSDLSAKLGITKASTTTQIGELRKAGLLRVSKNPDDARSIFLELTPTGWKRMEVTLGNLTLMDDRVSRQTVQELNRVATRIAAGSTRDRHNT